MHKIEVDEDVFELLEDNAKPFTDSPNTVLRRLLGLDTGEVRRQGKLSAPSNRAAPGSILPEVEYELPILEELVARRGRGHATEITDAVGERLADRLTDLDKERLDSGEVRWRNRVQFTRLTLKQRGLIAPDSPRGVWEITPAGLSYVESQGAQIQRDRVIDIERKGAF
jgi:Mrr N-terminal domain